MANAFVKKVWHYIYRRLVGLLTPGQTANSNLPSWVEEGELSAKGSELKYWQKSGLDKGTHIYSKYLQLFGLTSEHLARLVIADFGCGPFGGIFSVLPQLSAAYPIDVLADEYNAWGNCAYPIVPFDGAPTSVPEGSCDYAFCLNAIDHTPYPELIVAELWRILKPGGLVYLHVHLRTQEQVNKLHPIPWEEKDVRARFEMFEGIDLSLHDRDTVNDNDYRMLTAVFKKPL